MPTIYDVARRAGVSPATVSRVVNGNTNVDTSLADRVRDAMRELDYRPNAVARSLRRSRTNLCAVIVSDIENPFFTPLVRGAEDVAQRAGYSVVLCNSDDDPAKEAEYVDVARTQRMAGVIIAPSGPGAAAQVGRLLDAQVPVVVLDCRLPGLGADTVLVDNEVGAELATEHLIEAGYQRIGAIAGPRRLPGTLDRLRGFQSALRTHGLDEDDALIRHVETQPDGGYRAMTSLLAGEPRLDAVLVTHGLLSAGVIGSVQDHGLAVPDEIGLVAFDDAPWTTLVRPSLSVVAQPTYELGSTAAELLTRRIATPERPPSTVTLSAKLRPRDSSARGLVPAVRATATLPR